MFSVPVGRVVVVEVEVKVEERERQKKLMSVPAYN